MEIIKGNNFEKVILSILLRVKFSLTLVVLLSLSLFSLLHKLLQRRLALISRGKCGPPFIKVTLTELSISDPRHVFTLK